jgi:hypothetical protein
MLTMPAHVGQPGFGPTPAVPGTALEQQLATELKEQTEPVHNLYSMPLSTRQYPCGGGVVWKDVREGE